MDAEEVRAIEDLVIGQRYPSFPVFANEQASGDRTEWIS